MSDYVVSDTNLTAIANAIRTKGGTSANLSFPTGFVDAINAISGGGGSSSVELGSFTPESDVNASSYSIPHSLGSTPDFVVVMASAFEATTDLASVYIAVSFCSKHNLTTSNISATAVMWEFGNWPGRTTQWASQDYVSDTKFFGSSTFKVPYYASDHKLKAGVTYYYAVGKYGT